MFKYVCVIVYCIYLNKDFEYERKYDIWFFFESVFISPNIMTSSSIHFHAVDIVSFFFVAE